MAGLNPATHVFLGARVRGTIPGSSPGMRMTAQITRKSALVIFRFFDTMAIWILALPPVPSPS